MHFYPHEKIALLVDGASLHRAAQTLDLELDWGRLQHFLRGQGILVGSYFLTGLPEAEDGFQPIRKLLDWLTFNGWVVVERRGSIDADLSVAALELAEGIDHFVIGTGREEFVPLVEALQRKSCRVTILSTILNRHASDELRRAANDFLDLKAVREHIARAPRKEALPA